MKGLGMGLSLTGSGGPSILQSVAFINDAGTSIADNGDGRYLISANAGGGSAAIARTATAILTGNFVLEMARIGGTVFIGADTTAPSFANDFGAWLWSIGDDGGAIYDYTGGAYTPPDLTRGAVAFIDRIGSTVRILSGNDYAAATVRRTYTSQSTADVYAGFTPHSAGASAYVRAYRL